MLNFILVRKLSLSAVLAIVFQALLLTSCLTFKSTKDLTRSTKTIPIQTTTTTSSNSSLIVQPSHNVMLIMLENREYSSVFGSNNAPYLTYLANKYGYASNAYAATHPSLPNYLAIVSGNTFSITTDCESCSAPGITIINELASKHITWGAYFQSMPYPCFRGYSSSTGYAKKHNPFMYFPAITENPNLCDQIMPLKALFPVINTNPPSFIFVVPNLCNDGHNCPNITLDSWLESFIPTVISSEWFKHNGIIIITFDEGVSDLGCCNVAHGGHILTVVIKAGLSNVVQTTPVDTYGILATIEDLYSIPKLGESQNSANGSLLDLINK